MADKPFKAVTPKGQRVALALAYEGSHFYGWQSQRKLNIPTVQERLEEALARVADAAVTVHCAGRTDTGVHASHQLVHFDSPADRSEKAWVMGGNVHLPPTIRIKWARPVAADFHARHSAVARRYRYVILNQPVASAHMPAGLTWCAAQLDAALMHESAQVLLGELDFSAFRAAGCQSRTPMRNVHFIEVSRRGELVIIDIQANAFLHHMVRNIAGVLMAVGSGERSPEWVAEVLASRDRTQGGLTAKPHGLYLVDVLYPARYELPKEVPGPEFVAPLFGDGETLDAGR